VAKIFCGSCGEKLKVSDEVCPKCDSRDRNILGGDEGEVREGLKLKAKAPSGFVERELRLKSKRAGKTGRRAEDRLEIDHTSDKETRKLHEVWEKNEEGKWEKVYYQVDSFSAKRRKK